MFLPLDSYSICLIKINVCAFLNQRKNGVLIKEIVHRTRTAPLRMKNSKDSSRIYLNWLKRWAMLECCIDCSIVCVCVHVCFHSQDYDAQDLTEFQTAILSGCDYNKDGKINKKELTMILLALSKHAQEGWWPTNECTSAARNLPTSRPEIISLSPAFQSATHCETIQSCCIQSTLHYLCLPSVPRRQDTELFAALSDGIYAQVVSRSRDHCSHAQATNQPPRTH